MLFDPEDKAEVEVRGEEFILLRERDLHAVASERLEDGADRPVPLTGRHSAGSVRLAAGALVRLEASSRQRAPVAIQRSTSSACVAAPRTGCGSRRR